MSVLLELLKNDILVISRTVKEKMFFNVKQNRIIVVLTIVGISRFYIVLPCLLEYLHSPAKTETRSAKPDNTASTFICNSSETK